MKLEPSILYQQHAFSVGLLKILVAAAIVLALLCLVATIREVRDRPSSAAGWLGGAAIVAIVAGVMVRHMAAATSAYQRKAEVSRLGTCSAACVKGFGCRPLEGQRGVFGGRRPKPFTTADILTSEL
jgi:type IV secretory pathway TrbL component